MISERKLKKWRRITLEIKDGRYTIHTEKLVGFMLELTQELLDQRLLEQGRNNEKKI